VLSQHVHETIRAAPATTGGKRRLPFREICQNPRKGAAGLQGEIPRQATGAACFPRVVSKVLPHDALEQVVVCHARQPIR
jgi:hypothetical protein